MSHRPASQPSQVHSRTLMAEQLEARLVLSAESPLQNPLDAADVNNDGIVSAADALLVINELNRTSPGEGEKSSGGRFMDVNGDGVLSPLDALVIIHRLNAQTSVPPVSEQIEEVIGGDDSTRGVGDELIDAIDDDPLQSPDMRRMEELIGKLEEQKARFRHRMEELAGKLKEQFEEFGLSPDDALNVVQSVVDRLRTGDLHLPESSGDPEAQDPAAAPSAALVDSLHGPSHQQQLLERLQQRETRLHEQLTSLQQRINRLAEHLREHANGAVQPHTNVEQHWEELLDRLHQHAFDLEGRLEEVEERLEELRQGYASEADERLGLIIERLETRREQLVEERQRLEERLLEIVGDLPSEDHVDLDLLLERIEEQRGALQQHLNSVLAQVDSLLKQHISEGPLLGEMLDRLQARRTELSERLATLQERMGEIADEFLADSHESLRDTIDRLSARAEQVASALHDVRIGIQETEQRRDEGRLARHLDTLLDRLALSRQTVREQIEHIFAQPNSRDEIAERIRELRDLYQADRALVLQRIWRCFEQEADWTAHLNSHFDSLAQLVASELETRA